MYIYIYTHIHVQYICETWQDDLNMIRIVEFHVGLSQGTPIPEDHHGVSILGLRVGLNKGKALTPQAIFVPIEIASLGTNSICKTHPNPLFIAWMCAKLHFFMVKPRSTWYAA